MERIVLFLKEFWILLVIGVIGVGVIVYGLWGIMVPEQATVEIVDGDKSVDNSLSQRSELRIDLAGAVEKPGVYTMPAGSRIGDVLVMGGGLSSLADREWVAKTLNLAEEVKDGGKIYIPIKSELDIKLTNQQTNVITKSQGKVNINTASLGELDSLEGIGETRARLILDNRPYSKIDDLVSKAKIPESVYEKIKDKISIY